MVQGRNQEGNKKKFLELNESENETQQNIWDTLKAVLRGKFVVTLKNQKEYK